MRLNQTHVSLTNTVSRRVVYHANNEPQSNVFDVESVT